MDQLLEQAKAARREVPAIKVLVPFDKVAKFRSFGLKNVGYQRLPFTTTIVSQLLTSGSPLPLDVICGKAVYIFTRFVTAELRHSPSMVVIYDLSFELHRQYCDDNNARLLSALVRASLARTRHVVTISEHARREIIEFYGLDPADVVIATPAADPATFYRRDPLEIRRTREQYDIQDDYILTLSTLEPRKNLETLLDVYCGLPREIRDQLGLLLVGSLGWKTNGLVEKVLRRVEQGYNIMRPSAPVTEQHKPALLSGAAMLVYPSHYEGFGMPPLEALACGTPVIVGANSSLPQVVGDAAQLVPSDRPDLLHKAIVELYANLATRTADSNARGPAQAKRFCWMASAQVYLDLARQIANEVAIR
jgi:alpha-1,3-rhamnosyl/mannosyltransferase